MNVITTYLREAGRIGIWGVGVEGVSTLRFLASIGLSESVEVFDQNPDKAQATLAEKGVEGFQVGDQDDLAERAAHLHLIVVSPGIPIRKFPFTQGKVLENQMSLMLREFSGKVIGVTGTKGKSTFCSLLHKSFLAAGMKSLLVGNIGTPPLDLVDELDSADFIVGEMSSYQLDLVRHSPRQSVLLNLFEDHLDYHGGRDAYWGAKFNIFRYPVETSICYYPTAYPVVPEAVSAEAALAVNFLTFEATEFDGPVPESVRKAVAGNRALSPVHLRGMINGLWAILAELPDAEAAFAKAITEFKALNYRLQDEGLHRGIRFINDSISTVPECTLAAIRAYDECDCIIMGGMDRGVNLQPVARELMNWEGTLILLPDSGNRLLEELAALGDPPDGLHIIAVEKLEAAIEAAYQHTLRICVFSPGAPSYNRFLNFIDRGQAFSRLIREIAAAKEAS